jgi:hypothetical protein
MEVDEIKRQLLPVVFLFLLKGMFLFLLQRRRPLDNVDTALLVVVEVLVLPLAQTAILDAKNNMMVMCCDLFLQ